MGRVIFFGGEKKELVNAMQANELEEASNQQLTSHMTALIYFSSKKKDTF